ncbi:E3 ubiquitin-protein ligase RSL1-like [Primulina huaijiensis]|uniref:E3 ubiquitin-protein ligase RSL1-like n=1 Tax=Primulina huaijiensis TaxID=1492673 RepID=UPI003CC71EAA
MGNVNTRAHNPPPPRLAEELKLHLEGVDQEFTCEICIEPMLNPNKKFRNSDKCVHPFCTDCVIKYIRVKLEDGNSGRIRCPAPNCDHMLDPLACSQLIGPPLFMRWCDVLCEASVMGWEMCYCPHRDCNVLILNECGGDLRKSRCPKCKRQFCFRCKTVWHPWLRCKERGLFWDGNDVALRRLAALKRWKRCPSHKRFVELAGGCMIVKCRCGISFCYDCGNRVHQYWCDRCKSPSDRQVLIRFITLFLLVALLFALAYGFLNFVDERFSKLH